MSMKILGLDLGTSSIGTALRNPDLADSLTEQLEYFSSDIFDAGVGKDKTGEYSFAAERTKCRMSRRLHERRRRRLWQTLKYLIEYGCCPLSKEDLYRWMTYDKAKGLTRQYPIHATEFEQWIRLDFNGDGQPDYSSPYQLRRELATIQMDFSATINKYKLGRALYHIAQRRGFKSSKGETLSEQESKAQEKFSIDDIDVASAMQKSEEKKAGPLEKVRSEYDLPTIGCALAQLEDEGIRLRGSEYQAVRSQYKDEIKHIFTFQELLDPHSDLFRHIMSEKKGEGSIFYKEPLRSQKGLVGKCTLEPQRSRCPQSHPVFEEFRAWSFLNNIKYRTGTTEKDEWIELPLEVKEDLYCELFTGRMKSEFQFKEIRERLAKRMGVGLVYPSDGGPRTINYRDNTNVAGCPVTARLIKIFGPDWQTFSQPGTKVRPTHSKDKATHTVCYTADDIWHVCATADEVDEVKAFATERLGWAQNDERTVNLARLWATIGQGYAMLSRKAMSNINQFLRRGLIYSDAVLLAKIPDLMGVQCTETQLDELIHAYKGKIKPEVDAEKQIVAIVNALISNYKSLGYETGQFAYKDFEYTLQESDHHDIIKKIKDIVGNKTWSLMDAEEQEHILGQVTERYQAFFHDQKRDYSHATHLDTAIGCYLAQHLGIQLSETQLAKLYHPSMISVYKPIASDTDRSQLRLGSPNLGGIRNPVALRTLNQLRRKINAMLDAQMIDPEETRIVIETTRDLKDANERWAIETWQRQREAQNKEIEKILKEEFPSRDISKEDVDKARLLIDQSEKETFDKAGSYKKDVTKYRLWLEQGCISMYTGKPISLTQLFDSNSTDFEHTIPRSISFDSSDCNLTICESHYNRYIKKNLIPTQLPNYSKPTVIDGVTYAAIEPNLKGWKEKVEQLRHNVQFWSSQSRKAMDKSRKDHCIRQRHLWQMELDYWQGKLNRFTMTEVKDGFRNSQLVDTGIITRHAVAYLRSIFSHVDVQKGSVTAEFRKMLGVQSVDEKKDRTLHSHHAIDAIMLTVIPTAAKRDRMLQYFYSIEEKKHTSVSSQFEQNQLQKELEDCLLGGGISTLNEYVNSNILINHHSRDKALVPAHRLARVRGRIVNDKAADGSIHNRWQQGDSIRAKLHNETFYGAIADRTTGDIRMVARIAINSFKKLEELDKIVDTRVRHCLKTIIKKRIEAGLSFTDALKEDFWLLDKDGHEIHFDCHGRPLRPLRHVRCLVAAGRGFMTREKSLAIHTHAYTSTKQLSQISDRSHKTQMYAQNSDNYLFLLYEGIKKGKLDRKSRILNYFDIVNLNKSRVANGQQPIKEISELKKEPFYTTFEDKKISYSLSAIIQVGTRVLLWNEDPEEILSLDKTEVLKRLYVVHKFNNTGSDHIYIKEHIDAGIQPQLVALVANEINCLIEGRDFSIDELGNIHYNE